MKRRGNLNWGKPDSGPGVPTVTEFEKMTNQYQLTPDQYLQSSQLRERARRNMKSKFVPESLLKAWGFEIEASEF